MGPEVVKILFGAAVAGGFLAGLTTMALVRILW